MLIFFSLLAHVDGANRNAVPVRLAEHVTHAQTSSINALGSNLVLVDQQVAHDVGACVGQTLVNLTASLR